MSEDRSFRVDDVEHFLAALERLTPEQWQEVGERSARVTRDKWELVNNLMTDAVLSRHRKNMRGELDRAEREAYTSASAHGRARIEAMTAASVLGLTEADAQRIDAMRRAAVMRVNTLRTVDEWRDLPAAAEVDALLAGIFAGLVPSD